MEESVPPPPPPLNSHLSEKCCPLHSLNRENAEKAHNLIIIFNVFTINFYKP